ncbi:hypothetical protein LCGC14_1841820, partial [marine sediment metagenome]
MDSPVVEVSEIKKIYDSSPPIEALKSISFKVNKGEIFG